MKYTDFNIKALILGLIGLAIMVASLEPCRDRLNNAITYYKDRSFTKGQLMGLKNISQDDKLLVVFKLMPKECIRFAAAEIAELVLPIFESTYPNDNRPRLAIEAAKAKVLDVDAAHYAAIRAANATGAAVAAAYAADAVAYAAYAADAAAYAADAAARTAYCAANAAYYAAYAARAVDSAARAVPADQRSATEKLIKKIVLKYWKD